MLGVSDYAYGYGLEVRVRDKGKGQWLGVRMGVRDMVTVRFGLRFAFRVRG